MTIARPAVVFGLIVVSLTRSSNGRLRFLMWVDFQQIAIAITTQMIHHSQGQLRNQESENRFRVSCSISDDGEKKGLGTFLTPFLSCKPITQSDAVANSDWPLMLPVRRPEYRQGRTARMGSVAKQQQTEVCTSNFDGLRASR